MTGWMAERRWRPALLALPAILVLVAFFLVPMASALVASLHPHRPILGVDREAWTVANYLALGDDYHLGVLLRTLRISAVVTAVSLLVGYPVAYFCWTLPARARALMILAYLSPWLVSVVVKAYGWMVLLAENGAVNRMLLAAGVVDEPIQFLYSEFAVGLGLAHVYLVFLILPVFTSLAGIDPSLIRAARNLGASRLDVVRRVVLPLSLPGVLAGTVLVFTLTMAAFATPALLGGGRAKVVSYLAYEQALHLLNWSQAAAIGFLLLLITAVVVLSYQMLAGRLARSAGG